MNVAMTRVCVIGLGYIGLPTAVLAARHGMRVFGVDVNDAVVAGVNAGRSHVLEPELDGLVGRVVAEGRLNTKGRAVASRSKTGRGLVSATIFLLVPQVKLSKRLDLARDAARAVDGVPGLIVAKWVGV